MEDNITVRIELGLGYEFIPKSRSIVDSEGELVALNLPASIEPTLELAAFLQLTIKRGMNAGRRAERDAIQQAVATLFAPLIEPLAMIAERLPTH